jgi:mannose-6-phosphate isomerase-like protein (cupin superfamily)
VLESEERPWGSWHIINVNPGCKIKRIHPPPGRRLSYQVHDHCSEHWVVVFGRATCTIDGETVIAEPGHSMDVSLGTKHRLATREAMNW